MIFKGTGPFFFRLFFRFLFRVLLLCLLLSATSSSSRLLLSLLLLLLLLFRFLLPSLFFFQGYRIRDDEFVADKIEEYIIVGMLGRHDARLRVDTLLRPGGNGKIRQADEVCLLSQGKASNQQKGNQND